MTEINSNLGEQSIWKFFQFREKQKKIRQYSKCFLFIYYYSYFEIDT